MKKIGWIGVLILVFAIGLFLLVSVILGILGIIFAIFLVSRGRDEIQNKIDSKTQDDHFVN